MGDMARRLRARAEHDEGFTLIELLVVLLIMGILLAIAIPTYLSVTGGAKKSAAQSNLETALTAAKAYYTTNNGVYTSGAALVTALGAAGTSLSYVSAGTAVTSSSTISADAPNTSVAVMATSDGTNCYAVADVESSSGYSAIGVTSAGTYWVTFTPASSGSCDATAAEGTSTGWTTSPTSPTSTSAPATT